MKIHGWLFIVVVTLFFSKPAISYAPPTHEELSDHAVSFSSIAVDGSLLKNIGLDPWSSFEEFTDPNDISGDKKTITELFRDGADFEDNFPRSLNHFFDPVNNRGLTKGAEIGYKSPDWALDEPGERSEQLYSYKDAMGYFYLAMTSQAEDDRELNFAKTFQTLGQVIHHVQDMAQPEHVRNDAHCNDILCVFAFQYDPSYYEKYTNDNRFEPHISGLMSGNSYPTPVFATAREFWTTGDNKGIADFTNRNFLSKDSIGNYTNPALKLNANTVDINDLMGTEGQALCNAPFAMEVDAMVSSLPSAVFCKKTGDVSKCIKQS